VSDSLSRPRLPQSIFLKLLAIMLAMAVSLLFMVAGFFGLIVSPNLDRSVHRLIAEYARAVAATSPDLETARGIAARLGLQMRYEGPDGSWATADDLPSIEKARAKEASGRALGSECYLAPGGKGGTYLFLWDFHRRMGVVHTKLLWLLLVLILTVVVVAHAVLRRALRPLRSLHDGVVRMSEGDLDVVLKERTRDELGALTDAFNQMARRVKEMVRARDQLLLDVSHELRSPLTRMRVALALLPDSEKKRRMTADVAEMETMIAELLELERLREGRRIRTERQDLLPILREVADAFQERHPGVRVVTAETEVLLELDAERVRTVLRNLMENATKYSLPESRAVEVTVSTDSDTAVVRVTDDGHGLPESDLARLFEPFFRLDPSRSKKTGGYGLGLSMCRRIMEAHGGTIVAENNAGRGASFTLTFKRRA
jgi:signal transduction histidine kinase